MAGGAGAGAAAAAQVAETGASSVGGSCTSRRGFAWAGDCRQGEQGRGQISCRSQWRQGRGRCSRSPRWAGPEAEAAAQVAEAGTASVRDRGTLRCVCSCRGGAGAGDQVADAIAVLECQRRWLPAALPLAHALLQHNCRILHALGCAMMFCKLGPAHKLNTVLFRNTGGPRPVADVF